MAAPKGNLHLFRTDPKKTRDGVAIELEGGVRIFIARARMRVYRARRTQLLQPYLKEIRANTLAIETIVRIESEAIADTVLRGWEGLTDDDGNVVPYTPEKARELMTDPRYERFQDLVIQEAENLDNYREDLASESLGNSPSASTGSSRGGTESES